MAWIDHGERDRWPVVPPLPPEHGYEVRRCDDARVEEILFGPAATACGLRMVLRMEHRIRRTPHAREGVALQLDARTLRERVQ